MITQRYTVLCTIRFFHSYYEKGSCLTMQIKPSPSTQQRMEKAGLLWRTQADGFTLLAEVKSHIAPERYFPLDFTFHSTDPYFENFTRLPTARQGKCLIFSCGNTSSFTADDAHVWPLKPSTFRLNIESSAQPGDILSLQNAQGDTVLRETISTTADRSSYPFDLRNVEPGQYTLSVQNKPVLSFYSDEELYKKPPLGILSLQAEPISRFLGENENQEPIAYRIKWEARRTNWKYYIINRHKKNCTNFSIVNGGTTFKNLGETSLSEDLTADAVLVSEQPISLSEKPEVKFRLTAVSDEAQEYTLIDSLPAPSPQRLAFAHSEQGDLCSEIYVYI